MSDAMVTGRMAKKKKEQGSRVLKEAGLTASQAINLLYDRLIEEGDASFLIGKKGAPTQGDWAEAFMFVDSLSVKRQSKFHEMSSAQIKVSRLKSRGLM